MEDSVRTLVRRGQDLDHRMANITSSARNGADAFVGRITTLGHFPVAANSYFAVQVQNLTGRVAEGQTPSFGLGQTIVLAANLGTAIPGIGKQVVITQAGGRCVFRYDG